MTPAYARPQVSASGEIFGYKVGAIIFDCDGTLVHTADAHFTSIGTALGEIGVGMDRDWYMGRLGLSRLDLIKALGAADRSETAAPGFSRRVEDLYMQNLHRVREIEVVSAVARRYRDALPIAVASGGQRAIVEATLEAAGLRSLFDVIVTIEDVQRGKPAPDLFLLASRRLGIAPIDCLVFEDTDEGLEAARAAGIQAIDVRALVQVDPQKAV